MKQPLTTVPADGSGAMFDRIADRYDLLNSILSFGLHKRWRNKTIRKLQLQVGDKVLDLATGTADLALAIQQLHPQVQVIGVDPSARMLAVGEKKICAHHKQDYITLQLGDAQQLPFDDNFFDAVTIAFGIRNVPDRKQALREMARVTKAGKRMAILELSEPNQGLLAYFAKFYIHHLVPWVGAVLSGASEYRYLQRSIAAFPQPAEFAEMLKQSGWGNVEIYPILFGACHIFVGTSEK